MNIIYNNQLRDFMKDLEQRVEAKTMDKIPYRAWRFLHSTSICGKDVRWDTEIDFSGNTSIKFIDAGISIIPTREQVWLLRQYTAPNACNTTIKKENDTMKMPAMNFDFGPCKKGIALSPYGLAVSMDGNTWLTYNTQTDQTVDVTGFTFDFEGMIYKMPAAVTSIARGDMIVHNSRPMFVTDIMDNGIEVIDLLASEIKTVIPVTNMFGFNFVTKVVSFINTTNMAPSAEQPFGNIMPMLMMNAMMGNDNGDSNDFMKLMMLSSMMGGQNPFGQMFNFGGTAAGEVGSASK